MIVKFYTKNLFTSEKLIAHSLAHLELVRKN